MRDMRSWEALFGKKTPVDRLVYSLARGVCSECGNGEFSMGPRGGLCQNVRCSRCKALFNLAPFEDGWLGRPMVVELLEGSQQLSGGAVQRLSLPERAGAWVGEKVSYVLDLLDEKYGDTNAVDRMLLAATFIALVGATLSVIYIVIGARR